MPKVFDSKTGQVVEVDDNEYGQIVSNIGPAPEMSPEMSMEGQQPPVNRPINPMGVPLEELYQAQSRAIAAGDISGASQIGSMIDLEQNYMEQQEKKLQAQETQEVQGTTEQMFKASAAQRAIDELEYLYGRGDSASVGTEGDLSISPSATVFGKARGKGNAFIKSLTDPEFQEDLNQYKGQLDLAIGILTQAFGSGTPQDAEAQRLINSAPGPTSTDAEAKQWFRSVRNLIGTEDQDTLETDIANQIINKDQTQTAGGFQNVEPSALEDIVFQQLNQSDKKKEDTFGNAVVAAGDVLPAALATAGGFAGGVLGGGVGAIPGAAVGYAGGSALKNTIRDLYQKQDQDPLTQVEEAASGSIKNAALEALGLGVGKFILKPIAKGAGYVLQSTIDQVADLPLRSIRFAPSDLTNFASKHGQDMADFMVNRGYLGDEAIDLAAQDAVKFQDQFDSIAMNNSIQIPVAELKQKFADEITKLAGGGKKVVPSTAKNVAKNILDEWDNILQQLQIQGRDTVTPMELTEFRRFIDDTIPNSQFIDPSVKNVGIRLRKIMNDTVSEGVESRMIGEGEKGAMKKFGQELSRLYDFLEMAEKRSNKGRGTLVANIPRLLAISGGAAVGGPTGAIAGLGVEGLTRDPNVLKYATQAGRAAQDFGSKIAPAIQSGMSAIPRTAGLATQAIGQILGN